MGSSSSIVDSYHIHISLSTKHDKDKNALNDIILNLIESGITVTTTDSSLRQKETCNNLKNANVVIYCSTLNYGTCSTQAIEYSYLSENDILTYNVIVDPYENKTFAKNIKRFIKGDGYEISSIDEIHKIIKQIVA